jgi:hypothetical protein
LNEFQNIEIEAQTEKLQEVNEFLEVNEFVNIEIEAQIEKREDVISEMEGHTP